MKFAAAVIIILLCVGTPDAFFATQNHADFLRLVNPENPLPPNYRPDDLVRFQGAELRAPVGDAFAAMLAEMEAEGVHGLRLQSGYRCFSRQSALFEEKTRLLMAKGLSREDAARIASQSIQPPGASEHQLGLALDVSINGQLSGAFGQTAAGRWLAENCHRFGFVVRYPRDKTNVTRIIYEPWHLRFVGVPHAQIMFENEITLEEYRWFLAQFFMYVVWGEGEYFLVQLEGDEVVAEKKQNPVGE